jgi:hypothetical protein
VNLTCQTWLAVEDKNSFVALRLSIFLAAIKEFRKRAILDLRDVCPLLHHFTLLEKPCP